MIDKPGIYREVSETEYRSDPCPDPSLTQSLCKVLVDQSPIHALFEHPRLAPKADENGEKYDKLKAIGSAAHKIMLGRGKEIVLINVPDFKTKDAREKRDAALALGHVPILADLMDDVETMVAAAGSQLERHQDKDAFTAGSGEVMIAWQEDGFWYRALIDWLSDDMLTVDDYKTTGMSVAPHTLGIRAENAGWPIQAAFIERGLNILHPEGAGRRRFRFIAQENYRPFALVVAHMDEHWMTMGRKKVAAADHMWRTAVRSGRWAGYPTCGIVPDYPSWAENRWLDRETSGEFEQDPKLIMAG